MADTGGRFVWYELMTTDVDAASAFYTNVVGWSAHDASTPGMPYTLFLAGENAVGGLLQLPGRSRRSGGLPRWLRYVQVGDVDAASDCKSRRSEEMSTYRLPISATSAALRVVADQ